MPMSSSCSIFASLTVADIAFLTTSIRTGGHVVSFLPKGLHPVLH